MTVPCEHRTDGNVVDWLGSCVRQCHLALAYLCGPATFRSLEHQSRFVLSMGTHPNGVAMSKRLGKRERAKMRAAQGAKSAIISANLKSPPERGLLSSPSAKDTLLVHSHSGFRDPKGNLAKARVERAAARGLFRFECYDPLTDLSYGGSDRLSDLANMRKLQLERAADPVWTLQREGLRRLRFRDTKPWLDVGGNANVKLRALNRD